MFPDFPFLFFFSLSFSFPEGKENYTSRLFGAVQKWKTVAFGTNQTPYGQTKRILSLNHLGLIVVVSSVSVMFDRKIYSANEFKKSLL